MRAVLEPDAAARTAPRRSRRSPARARRRASPDRRRAVDVRRPRSRNSHVAGEPRAASGRAPASPLAVERRRADRPRRRRRLGRQRRAARSRAPTSAVGVAPSGASAMSMASAAICRPGCAGVAGQLNRRVAGEQRVLERLAVRAVLAGRCRGRSAPAGRPAPARPPVIRASPRSSSASSCSSSARQVRDAGVGLDRSGRRARRCTPRSKRDRLVRAGELGACPTVMSIAPAPSSSGATCTTAWSRIVSTSLVLVVGHADARAASSARARTSTGPGARTMPSASA